MSIEIADVEVKLERVSDNESEENEEEEGLKRKRINRELDTNHAISGCTFKRMVKDIAYEVTKGKDIRWEANALEALQEDAEMYLIETFHRANKAKKMCKQETLRVDHMIAARQLPLMGRS